MNMIRGTLVAAVGLITGVNASAQDGPGAGQMDELKQGQQELRGELQSVKAELQQVRAELKQVLGALKVLQAQARKVPQQRQRPAMEMLGKPAPAMDFKTYTGKEAQVGGKSGKPEVIYVYASWCGYSNRAIPGINKLYNDYKAKGVEVYAVSEDGRQGRSARTEEQVLAKYNELKLTLPLILDPAQKVGGGYKARSFPTTFVVGADGVVESVHVGAKQNLGRTIASELDVLLAGKTRADFAKQE